MIKLYKFRVAIAFLAIGFFIGISNLEVKAETNKEELVKMVSEETGLQEEYIEYLCILGIQNESYMDKFYNIYSDTVIKSEGSIFNFENTQYQKFSNIKTTGISRPSEYFLPDSIYSISYDIKTLMQYNYYKNRGGYQKHFESYNEDTKQFIVFCESIIQYYGDDNDCFTRAYELYILGYIDSIEESLRKNGITNDKVIYHLKRMFDMRNIKPVDDLETLKDDYEMPYIIGYTTQENMLEAAISLVGRVRYTWAGGHAGTSNIKGINPVWLKWEQLYRNSVNGEQTCIKPSGSWCPIHGYNEDDRCINNDMVSDFNDYLALRAETLNIRELNSDKYKNMLDYINEEDGTAHRLDGLDCSGYSSWVFNQMNNTYNIDSSAMYFTRQSGIESIEFGSELQPGDIFAWTSHIVVILGKVKDGSKVYVTIEQTPNTLKFGTIYYSGYSSSDLEYGMQIAREANMLIGDITEEPHSYCMNTVGHYSVDIEDTTMVDSLLGNVQQIETKEVKASSSEDVANEDVSDADTNVENAVGEEGSESTTGENTEETQTITTVKLQYIDIGRFKDSFIDLNTNLVEDKTINDSTAIEILQYLIKKMPLQYVMGYSKYSGNLFDINTVSTDVGTTLIRSNNEE